jgi:hypothetical protein
MPPEGGRNYFGSLIRKRLTNYTAADGGVADAVRLAQAAGVSSTTWLIGRLASPGRTEPR